MRWKHTMYQWLKASKVEMAVVAELLLRGPQTEGELRARASRMEPIADLPALQAILEALVPRGLVQYLSPPGQKRGVYVAHGLYPPEELEKVRQAFANRHAGDEETPARLSAARVDLRGGRPAGLGRRDRRPPLRNRSAPRRSREAWPPKFAHSNRRSEFDRMTMPSLIPRNRR